MNFKYRRIKQITNGWYTIEWTLGNFCNFNCKYCFDTANLGTHKPPDMNEQLMKNVDHMIAEVKSNMPDDAVLQVIFTGGEPTTYKELPKLAARFKEKGIYVMVVTNGSMPITWWEKHIYNFDSIMISMHTDETDKEHIKKLVDVGIKNNKIVSGSILVGNHNYEKALQWYNDFYYFTEPEYINFRLRLSTIRKTDRNKDWKPLTTEQIKYITKIMNKGYALVRSKRNPKIERLDSKYDRHHPKKYVRGLEEKLWNYWLDQKDLTGSWQGYQCFAPSQFIQIDEESKIGKLACGMEIFDKELHIAADDFIENFKLPKSVICNVTDVGSNCNCLGLADSSKIHPKYIKIDKVKTL